MRRQLTLTLCALLLSTLTAGVNLYARQETEQDEPKEQAEKSTDTEKKAPPLRSGELLDPSRPSGSLKFSTLQLERRNAHADYAPNDPSVDAEEELVRLDSSREKRMVRLFHLDGNGRRRLFEVHEVQVTYAADGGEKTVRTISRPDGNGRLRVQQEEVQEVTSQGEDSFEIQLVISVSSGTGLRAVEQLLQTETRHPDGHIEVDRSRFAADPNGKWLATERRQAVTTRSDTSATTEETIYRANADKRFRVAGRVVSREETDPSGVTRQVQETAWTNANGRLEVTERLSLTQTQVAEGTTQMVQEREVLAAGSGRMTLDERLIESSSDGAITTLVEVADQSGRMQPVRSFSKDTAQVSDSVQKTTTRSH